MRVLIISSICLALLLGTLNSSGQQPYYRNYTVNDGLASPSVYYVFQDSRGFIWFGTEEGVSMYNGYEFVNFTTDDGLSDNEVFTIYEDSKGRIWFLTFNGSPSYYYQGKMYNRLSKDVLDKASATYYLTTFLEDSYKNIWIGTAVSGIFLINKDNVVFKYDTKNGLPSNRIMYVWEDRNSRVYIMTSKGIAYLEGNSNQLVTNTTFDRTYFITRNAILPNGDMIYFHRRQAYIFDQTTTDIRKLPDLASIPAEVIFVRTDNEENLWVGTRAGAIFYENCELNDENAELFLKGKTVTSVMQDREGNNWFSTQGDGVYYTSSKQALTYTTNDGLLDNNISCIYGDGKGNLWLGGNKAVFSRISPGVLQSNRLPLAEGTDKIKNMLIDNNNNLWIGTENAIIKKTANGAHFYHISMKSITLGQENDIWISAAFGTYHLSITDFDRYQVNPLGHDFDFISLPIDPIISERSYCFAIDTIDKMYLGTISGLFSYDGERAKSMKNLHPALGSRITDIDVAKDKSIWVTTHGKGLVVIQPDSIYHITISDGLSSNICKNVFTDDMSRGWIATNRGLSYISFQQAGSYETDIYNIRDGIASNEVNDVYVDGNDVWVATAKGLTQFDMTKIRSDIVPPIVHFVNVQVNGNDSVLQHTYNLAPGEYNIDIEFIGLSFRSEGNLLYQYKMIGLDSTWRISKSNAVAYTGLKSGNYEFHVTAFNERIAEENDTAILKINISRPYWEQTWFLFIYILIGFAVVFTVFKIGMMTSSSQFFARISNAFFHTENEEL